MPIIVQHRSFGMAKNNDNAIQIEPSLSAIIEAGSTFIATDSLKAIVSNLELSSTARGFCARFTVAVEGVVGHQK